MKDYHDYIVSIQDQQVVFIVSRAFESLVLNVMIAELEVEWVNFPKSLRVIHLSMEIFFQLIRASECLLDSLGAVNLEDHSYAAWGVYLALSFSSLDWGAAQQTWECLNFLEL